MKNSVKNFVKFSVKNFLSILCEHRCGIICTHSHVLEKKKAKLKELSNNISDRSEAKGTGIMSDLLLVNGEARQLVANPHYTILLSTHFNVTIFQAQ